MQPSPMEETEEYIVSERFRGEDGKVLPFKLRKLDQATANALRKKCQTTKTVRGQIVERTDEAKYTSLLIIESVIEPNFKDKEMCDYYKLIDPADVPGRMLSVGEYGNLSSEILRFNDFDTPEKIEEEAKN